MRLGVSYHGSRRLEHVGRDLDAIAAAGASLVVHCVTEEDVFYRPARIGELIDASHARGLEAMADPWGVLGLFGGEATSFALARDPHIRQTLSDGSRPPGACPNHPRTAAWLGRWLDVVLAAGADGVLWDEPHLWLPAWDDWNESAPDVWACRCVACRRAWSAARQGATVGPFPEGPPGEDPTGALRRFRQDSILRLLAGGASRVSAAGRRNAVTLLPVEEGSVEHLDWDAIATLPGMEDVGTDPYWFLHDRPLRPYVGDWARRAAISARGSGRRSHLWIALFGVPPERSAELAQAVDIAAAAGIDDLLAWSYPGGAAPHADALPEWDAWQLVAQAVRDATPVVA